MGVSAVTAKAEVYSAENELLKGIKQRLKKEVNIAGNVEIN